MQDGASLPALPPLDVPPPPAVYDADNVDEMSLCGLAVLSTARQRLVAQYAYDPRTARTVVGVLDELAAEIVHDATEDDDEDDYDDGDGDDYDGDDYARDDGGGD